MGHVFCRSAVFFLSVGLFYFSGMNAHAADSMRINPTKIRLVIAPGDAKSGTIEVENTFAAPISVKAVLEDWKYSQEHDGTKEFMPPGTHPLSCAKWISVSPVEFDVPSLGTKRVNYTVRVPEGASGGHYAVLFFESLLSQPQLHGAAMGVMVRIGAIFYIEPEGTVTRNAEIANLSVKKESQAKPLVVALEFKNTGNSDVTCAGTFHVIDKEGMVLARQDFERIYTLPGDTERVSAAWDEPLAVGVYDLVLTFDLGRAAEEAGTGRGPVISKEAKINVGAGSEIISVGELK